MRYFIDANVILRFLLKDHEEYSRKAKVIFEEIRKEKALGLVNSLVIHEVLYVSINVYRQERKLVASKLIALLKLENLEVLDLAKKDLVDVLSSFSKLNVDFPDLVYAKICENNKMAIISFDRHFDKLGVKRIESI